MNNEIFRPARKADAERIWELLCQAKAQMKREGLRQWNEHYPLFAHVERDLEAGKAWVLEREGAVIACGTVDFDGEPAYEAIEGAWEESGPYVVLHRLAVADGAKGQGVAGRFMEQVGELARRRGATAFRVDTHLDNRRMLCLFERLGFLFRGKIHYPQGERLAYEKPLRG